MTPHTRPGPPGLASAGPVDGARRLPVRRRSRWVVFLLLTMALSAVGIPGKPSVVFQTVAWAMLLGAIGGAIWLWRRDGRSYERALAAEASRRAVAEDRLAIARELHDLLSGSLGAITVRAAVAQHLDDGSQSLRQALADVETASREATFRLREAVALLRGQVVPTSQEPALTWDDFASGVEACVERARALGLEVATDVDPVTVAAHRRLLLAAVHEGLSNVAHHAGPTHVQLRLGYAFPQLLPAAGKKVVVMTMVDRGPAEGWVARPGTGTGLQSLAEQVASAGGAVHSTLLPTGFRLHLELPEVEENT